MYLTVIVCVAIGVLFGALLGSMRSCETGGCPLTANPKRGALWGGFMGLLVAGMVTSGGTVSSSAPNNTRMPVAASGAESVSEVAPLGVSGKSVLYFYADWCPTCRSYTPTFEKVAERLGPDVHFTKVNVDKMPDLAKRLGVTYVPTTIVAENGKEKNRFVGAVSEGTLSKVAS